MKVKNNTKRLIVVNFKDGKAWKSLPIGAGETTKDIKELTEDDIKMYKKDNSLEMVVDKADDSKTTTDIVLPENPDAENMKALNVDDLKLYCKQNNIKGYSKLKEDELITLILGSLEAQE